MVYQVTWTKKKLIQLDIVCGDSVHISWNGEMHGLSNTDSLECDSAEVLQDIIPFSLRGDAQVKFDQEGTYYFFCKGRPACCSCCEGCCCA
jgi:hypothetical protein